MSNTNIGQFTGYFNNISALENDQDQVAISFTKGKSTKTEKGSIDTKITKETKVFYKNRVFYVEQRRIEQITSIIKKSKEVIDPTITTTLEQEEISEESLTGRHAYLMTLFKTLNQKPEQPLSTWQSFKAAPNKIKWIVEKGLLDSFLVGGLVGRIIAFSANKGQSYYVTVPAKKLADTLGPLIFPAGLKKPTLQKKGVVVLDKTIHTQYKALQNCNLHYQRAGEETAKIDFKKSEVPVVIRGKKLQLETCSGSNNLVDPEKKDHPHLLYFNGNSGCFQDDLKMVAETLLAFEKEGNAVTARVFNYQGVLNSEGEVKIAQDLVDAGIAQVQALLDAGVPAARIVLHGISLGGSVGSNVAAHFFKKGVHLGGMYASRTFASTTRVGEDFFNRALSENIFSRIISSVCLPFIKIGTWGSGWDLDTGKAFFSLPKRMRQYAVVISSKKLKKAYRESKKESLVTKFFHFILGKQTNPMDDAILRTGLHDSWERRLESLWIKCGFYGLKERRLHAKEKLARKMVAVDLNTKELLPEIDAHAKANYGSNYNEEWHNHKRERAVGMVHRTADGTIEMNIEAGKVFREAVIKMASRPLPSA